MKRIFIAAMGFLWFSAGPVAADMLVKGFIDSYHGVGLTSPHEYLSSRTRLRLEGQFSGENALAFVSVNAVYNDVVTAETGLNLREAYAEYATDLWDFRIGRQIIIWGKAEGLQVTDNVSPKDYSESLARDFDDMRIPVDALKARLLGDRFTFEFIWIPVFTSAVVPLRGDGLVEGDASNPWSQEIPPGITDIETDSPDLRFLNSEVAAKLSYNSSAIDCSVSAFYTWDDPGICTVDGTTVTQKYYRYAVFGFDFSVPFSEFVFRGEAAWYLNRHYGNETMSENVRKRHSLNALAGIDWSPGSNWTLSMQVQEIYITDYHTDISDDEHTVYGTFSVSKKLFRETMTLSSMVFYGFIHRDIYNRSYVEYSLTDELHLTAGVDLFFGDGGSFGSYRDNSQFFIKGKYSF